MYKYNLDIIIFDFLKNIMEDIYLKEAEYVTQFHQVNWDVRLTTAYYTSCLSFIFSIREIPLKLSSLQN